MRQIRVYVDQTLQADAELELPRDAAHHLVRVLRLRGGDRVTLFNGNGREHPGEVLDGAARASCRVRLGPATEPTVESPLRLTLIQGIGRGERMDWAIQKSTELGVERIQPVFTDRTEVRLDGARASKRLHHWQHVAIAASEQSGRVRVPRIDAPLPLRDLEPCQDGGLFLDPRAVDRPSDLKPTATGTWTVVVGPEGGLSEAETAWLTEQGFRGLKLGPRVLRTETAGPAVLAMLQTRFGDW